MRALAFRQACNRRGYAGRFLDHLIVRAAQIGEAVRFRNRKWQCDFIGASRYCIVRATQIWYQYGNGQAGNCLGEGNNFGCVCKLGQQLGGDEASNLYFAHARG